MAKYLALLDPTFWFQLAEYLELPDLSSYLTNIINKELFLNDDLTVKILEVTNFHGADHLPHTAVNGKVWCYLAEKSF